jgi:NAD(P)-dependent dehydrogenase (short-subunit alcohol dehydrogenase family)
VIIITGANNGIGLAMTRALVDRGDRVAALDLDTENLEALDKDGDRLRAHLCDVTDRGRTLEVIADLVQAWERLDVLVNNACIALFKPYLERTQEEIRREFEVNYFGYLNMIDAVLPVMRERGYGVIHNVSSGVGITGYPGISGYASTKGAIEALTRTLDMEFADFGITVNLMHPPLTRTRSSAPLGVPSQMMADPEEVGRKLAKKVGQTAPVLTPDLTTGVGIAANQHFPVLMGRFLARMAVRAERAADEDSIRKDTKTAKDAEETR